MGPNSIPEDTKPTGLPWWGNLVVTLVCAYVLCGLATACLGFPTVDQWCSKWFHICLLAIGIAGIKWFHPMTTAMQRVADVIADLARQLRL